MQNEKDVWQEEKEGREEMPEEEPCGGAQTAASKTREPPKAGEGPASQGEREHLPAALAEPPVPPKANAGEERVLFVQLLLCALIVAFAWFARSSGASFFPAMQDGFSDMISSGVEFSTDNLFARFADAMVEELRLKLRGLLEKLEEPGQMQEGAGGYWPVSLQGELPEGASLEAYELPIELSLPVTGVITSGYGFRANPVNGAADFHAGIDISAAEGTPVLAAQDGLVVRTGFTRLRGYFVIVRHTCGVQTLYQHLSCIFVRGGEIVSNGQPIATSGSTGYVTGPHLHLELLLNGVLVDPAMSLPALTQ